MKKNTHVNGVNRIYIDLIEDIGNIYLGQIHRTISRVGYLNAL